MQQPPCTRRACGGTRSRATHALHAAHGFDLARRSHYDVQAHMSRSDIDAMMDDDNAQKESDPPQDPRPPGGSAELQLRTKAELKCFEYAPRSTLVDFRIPKTASHTVTSDETDEGGSSQSLGFETRDDSGHGHVLEQTTSRGRGTPRGM
jgi:hypothetical protein